MARGTRIHPVVVQSRLMGAAAAVAALLACSGQPAGSPAPLRAGQGVFTAGSTPMGLGSLRSRAARGLEISPVPVNTAGLDSARSTLVGLGSYIVNAASDCAGCHTGSAGFLAGGVPFFLDAQGHVVWTRNLTPDPDTGLKLTLDEFKEAMRTGRDFHPDQTKMLLVMPWTTLRWASDLDLQAIYAYLRSLPPVNNALPPDDKSDLPVPASIPFPAPLYTDGDIVRTLFPAQTSFDPRRGLSISPRAQPAGLAGPALWSYGVGSYIANSLMHCNDCHTHPDRTADFSKVNTAAFLTGGAVFAVPPPLQPILKQVRTMSADLKGANYGFFYEPDVSFEAFQEIIVTGTHADETPPRLLGFPMNIVAGNLANLLDSDLQDLYAYVKDLPATTGPADQPRQDYARWCAADADCEGGESCATATNECVGGTCETDLDCGACQTCGGGACQAPAADSACVASAQ